MAAVEVLKYLGLTGNEAKVYFALCELGPSVASDIAEKAGVHRALSYGTLARLAEKGLVSQVTKEGRKFFEAAAPARLQALMEEREHRVREGVASLTEELSKIYRVSAKPTVEVFTGVEGIKAILTEELASTKKGDSIYYYRASPEIAWKAKVFVSWYHKKRADKGVMAKAVFDSAPDSLKRAREFAALGLSEVRLITETLPTPITYHIFADRVAILSTSREEWLGILIKSEAIAGFFRNSFEFAWKQLKPIK
jgi:sugar-specific transcriptional regulator TrmB